MVVVKNERILNFIKLNFANHNFIKHNILNILGLICIGLNQCANSEVFNWQSSSSTHNSIFDSQSYNTFLDMFDFKTLHNTSLLKSNLLASCKSSDVMQNNMTVLSCNEILKQRDTVIVNNISQKLNNNYTDNKSQEHIVTEGFVSGYKSKFGFQGILKANTSFNNIFSTYKNSNDNILKINIQEHNSNRFFNLSFVNNNTKSLNLKKTKVLKNKPKINTNKVQSKHLSINEIIKQTESNKNIPSGLLRAIGKIESGLQPYAVNYNGRGHSFSNKESALAFVNNLIKRGITNFSVGCFQLHYKSHRNKFSSVNSMFDPASNAEYAAKLLNRLYREGVNSWSNAIKRYHAGGSYRNMIYYSKIVRTLGKTI